MPEDSNFADKRLADAEKETIQKIEYRLKSVLMQEGVDASKVGNPEIVNFEHSGVQQNRTVYGPDKDRKISNAKVTVRMDKLNSREQDAIRRIETALVKYEKYVKYDTVNPENADWQKEVYVRNGMPSDNTVALSIEADASKDLLKHIEAAFPEVAKNKFNPEGKSKISR